MFKIDTKSFIPLYEQIQQQIKNRISLRTLKPGELLPSIRELASSLQINPNTVARAYRELEREGLIITRKGRGCFITGYASAVIRKERTAIFNRALDDAIEEARKLNLNSNEIKKIFNRRLAMRTSKPAH